MLKIWLPLNGDLHNQGLSDITVTNNGATINNSGKIGKCYEFGSSKYVSINNKIIDSNAFTISFWVNANNITGNKCLLCCRNATNKAFAIYLIGAQIRVDTGTNWATGYSITATTWTHITFISNGNQQKLYINGSLEKTRSATINTSSITELTTIGCEHINGSSIGTYFIGCINDVRIYDHALSPKEVKEISKGLVLHYPLNRGGFGGDNIIAGSSSIEKQYTYPASNYKDWYAPTTKIIPTSTQYILSFYAKSTVNGDKIRTHFYSPNTTTTCVSSQGVTKTASDGSMDFTLSTEWKRYWVIYTQTETTAAKHVICPRLVSGQGTGTVSMKCVKLEEGSTPTPWIPSSADALYSSMGLNSNIEYDVSGYQNNLISSTLHTFSSDSPRYNLCTIFNSSVYNPFTVSSKNIGLGGNPEFTISAWIYCNDDAWINDYQGIFWFGGQGTSRSAALSIHNGKLDIDFWNNRYEATNQLIVKTWYHIVATKTSGAINSTCKLYVNGQSVTGSGNTSNSPTIDTISNIIIGSLNNTTTRRWNGMISDVRVYTTALSADDILDLYHTPASITNNGTLMTQGELSEV